MRRSRLNFGFTLVELILVMLVIAICAAIAAPNLAGFSRGRNLPNAAIALVTTARWCRVQALSDGAEYRLNLDASGGRWWATKADDTGTTFTDVKDDLGSEYKLPEGVSIQGVAFQGAAQTSDAGAYISFRAGGQTDVATITLAQGTATVLVGCDSPLGSYHVLTPAKPGGAP